MLFIILGIGMLLAGLYALIAGKGPGFLFGGKDYDVIGTPARLIGILLMVPLPLDLLTRLVLGLAMGEEGTVISEFCEVSIYLIVMVVALVAIRRARQPRQPADPTIPPGPST